jgi:hypothetical protein
MDQPIKSAFWTSIGIIFTKTTACCCDCAYLRHLLVLPSKVQAKLNMRAYAFASDVVDALGDALFVAAPQHFKLESAVSANELIG